MDVSKYKEMFVSEAKENLQVLNLFLLELERKPRDLKPVRMMFRVIHSLKSMAATMNYNKITRLCHAMEDALDEVRKGRRDLTSNIVERLFSCLDNLELSLNKISEGEEEADVGVSVSELQPFLTFHGGKPAFEEVHHEGVSLAETPSSLDKIREIRVKVETLDTLVNFVEELLVNKMLLDQLFASGKIEDMPVALDALGRTAADLQYTAMKARLVPVAQIFDRFPRMVRDLSRKEKKRVSLVIEGAEIELDRTIIDKVGEPLVHLLRNAVDHGIETPANREKLNKPAVGTIRLVARKERDYAEIEVEDDGKGISEDRIKRVAVENGIIAREEAINLDHDNAMALLFDSRFSTSKMVTEVSGRGVGLSIVKETVESLGGTVRIAASPEKGAKFTLRFPLTLAIITALLTRAGEHVYAVPLAHVVRLVRTNAKDIKTILGQEVAVLSEGNVPLLRLHHLLDLPCENEERPLIVIVKRTNEFLGLIVDDPVERRDIIVKPLGKMMRRNRIFAGFTILGDGTPALILDVNSLFQSVAEKRKHGAIVSMSRKCG